LTGQALKSGRSPEAHLELLQNLHRRAIDVGPALDRLIPKFQETGVLLGSHDDPSVAVRKHWNDRCVGIAEFPETLEVARAAKLQGDGVVLGAPNVVRGGSHSGKLSAREAVEEDICDALASDYHYPSLLQAVIVLADGDKAEFAAAWELVSSGPAKLLGFADRGHLSQGMRADLLVFDPAEGRIGATISGGQVAHLNGQVAHRFLR
jgi:alpha-D-ribose 1-methylphosphonate 5-triphosphate diphosphatase